MSAAGSVPEGFEPHATGRFIGRLVIYLELRFRLVGKRSRVVLFFVAQEVRRGLPPSLLSMRLLLGLESD
jgi:hypothetical protein